MRNQIFAILSFGLLFTACNGGFGTETTADTASTTITTIDSVSSQPTVAPSEPATPPFQKELSFEKINFKVLSAQQSTGNTCVVVPSGFAAVNDSLFFEVVGKVTDAEVGDIDGDNSPELLIKSVEDNKKPGHIYLFSGNNNKSLSQVNIEDAAVKPKALDGYQGEDDFALVEGVLARRFPIYNNDVKTGKMRQIQYKLTKGEAMKQLKISKVFEF